MGGPETCARKEMCIHGPESPPLQTLRPNQRQHFVQAGERSPRQPQHAREDLVTYVRWPQIAHRQFCHDEIMDQDLFVLE